MSPTRYTASNRFSYFYVIFTSKHHKLGPIYESKWIFDWKNHQNLAKRVNKEPRGQILAV